VGVSGVRQLGWFWEANTEHFRTETDFQSQETTAGRIARDLWPTANPETSTQFPLERLNASADGKAIVAFISFAVGPIPRNLSMTVSGAERLRLGGSSGGNTAGQPSDDGCYENGKAWIPEQGWIGQMPRGLLRGSLLSKSLAWKTTPSSQP